jgi:hypothetical protein
MPKARKMRAAPGVSSEVHAPEVQRARGLVEDERAGQQQHARAHLDEQVAHGHAEDALAARGLVEAPRQDQEHRAERRELPEEEEREQVARERGADGRPRIDQGGHVLERALHVEGVEAAQERRDVEDDPEHSAEGVHPHQLERVAEQRGRALVPEREQREVRRAEQRQGQHVHIAEPLGAAAEERHEQRAQDHEGARKQLGESSAHDRSSRSS